MLHYLCVALLVLQCDGLCLLLLVTHIRKRYLVAWAFLCNYLLKLSHACHFLSVDSHNHVALFQSSVSSGSVVSHLVDVHTFHGAEIHFFAFFFLHVDKVLHIATLDTDHCTLNSAILLQVGYNLIHNSSWDGKTITAV